MTNVPGDLKHGKTWTARLWGMKSRWLNICLHFYVWFVVTSSDHRKSLKKILIIFLLHEINKSALIFIKHFRVRFQSRDKKLCLNEISHRICRDLKNQILPEERWTYFKKKDLHVLFGLTLLPVVTEGTVTQVIDWTKWILFRFTRQSKE